MSALGDLSFRGSRLLIGRVTLVQVLCANHVSNFLHVCLFLTRYRFVSSGNESGLLVAWKIISYPVPRVVRLTLFHFFRRSLLIFISGFKATLPPKVFSEQRFYWIGFLYRIPLVARSRLNPLFYFFIIFSPFLFYLKQHERQKFFLYHF